MRYLLISTLLIISSCSIFTTTHTIPDSEYYGFYIKRNKPYFFKDYNSGLCFAATDLYPFHITNVPCTKEVENLLMNKLEIK
jgi:hypothetical protein